VRRKPAPCPTRAQALPKPTLHGEELSYLSFGSDVDRFLACAKGEDRAALTALIEHEVR